MCIAFVGSRDAILDMVLEQVFIRVEGGELCAHEVYDVFFRLRKSAENEKIICISPHRLRQDDAQLAVHMSGAPGSGTDEDIFYESKRGIQASYDPASGEFFLTLPRRRRSIPDTNTTVSYKGIVCTPLREIPPDIENDPLAIQMLAAAECGTVFELNLGKVTCDKCYAFRLILDPLELIGLPKKRPLDDREINGFVSKWGQDATINCHKTCHNDFLEILTSIKKEQPNCAEAAAIVEHIIVDKTRCLLSPKRQQIVLIAPNGTEITTQNPEGCVWQAMKHVLKDDCIALEWMAGADEYWRDDVESVARHLYEYFSKYAAKASKTKEEASTAIDLRHDNSSLVVNALCDHGALRETSEARYSTTEKKGDQLEDVFHNIGTDRDLLNRFFWTGYRIRYTIQFSYLTPADRTLLEHNRRKNQIAFWLSIIAAALGLISLVLGLISVL